MNENDLCALPKYLSLSPSHLCDLTLGNIYMWRNELSTSFAVRNDTLIVRKETEKGHFAYLYPLGLDVEGALEEIEAYALSHHERLAFYALSEEQALSLGKRYAHHQILSLRSWSDYLYRLSDLRDFPGKEFSSKRHNAAKFHKLCPNAVFKIASEADSPRLNAFLEEYLAENSDRDISLEEISLTREMISHPSCIHAVIGYYEADGKILGFSLGEVKNDCLYDHIEKALRSYEGIYQALTSDFLRTFGGNCAYTNREEDDGNEGLRNAKLQLHPVEVLSKFYLEVTNPFDLVKELPSLENEEVSLGMLEEQDKELYANMAKDDELNRYWGYDYRIDLPQGVTPDGSYFLEGVKEDNESRKFLSYIIKDKRGRFLGEATAYHFTSLGGAELGIRLVKEAQGKGYAKEALSLLIAFFKRIGLRSLDYECYLANEASSRLAESVGFRLFRQDRQEAYYTLSLSE